VLVPLGKNEIPNIDDKDSFNLRVSAAEIAMDSSDLANVLNSYVFARPHSPLTQLSLSVEKGHLRVKGKLHDKGDIPFETEEILIPTADGKIRLHSEKIKAMHLPVKGLMDLFGIDLGSLIKEGKVPGVEAQEDDLILDLEQILPPPHIEGKVVSVRMEGEKIIQTFGDSDAKTAKNIRAGNYMAFKNNRVRLGKLVMNDTDLVLIDMDPKDPLDFFLDHYKEQLSAGYSKLTPAKRSEVAVRNLLARCAAEGPRNQSRASAQKQLSGKATTRPSGIGSSNPERLSSDFRPDETVVTNCFTCIIGASVHSRILHALSLRPQTGTLIFSCR
jgi:hypothetical protein